MLRSLWGVCPRKSVWNLQIIPRQLEKTVCSKQLPRCPRSPSHAEELLPPTLYSRLFLCAPLLGLMGCQVLGMGKCPVESGGASHKGVWPRKRADGSCWTLFVCSAGIGLGWVLIPTLHLFLFCPHMPRDSQSLSVFSVCCGLRPCLGMIRGR